MKLKKMHWIGMIAGVLLVGIDLVFVIKNEKMLFFLAGIAAGIAALPFVVGVIIENREETSINDMFLEFSRNLAEGVAAGTPVSKSIVNMRNKNYGSLSPYVRKLANQIELGIPIERALRNFAGDVDNPVVKRAVALISEAEKAGGEIDYILDSTAKSISEIEKLKKERRAAIYNLVVQGYIIFFIFIGIILVMEFKIIPLTTGVGSFSGFSWGGGINTNAAAESSAFDAETLTRPFLYLLLTQGLFAGLVIGKLTEGSVKSGIKHSFVLMITAYLVSTGSRLFLA